MYNPENADHLTDPVHNIDVLPSSPPIPVPGIELPEQEKAKQPRNQHLKVAEPKDKQFTSRCTTPEFELINKALKENNCRDIVQLTLYAINLFKKDCLTPFKT